MMTEAVVRNDITFLLFLSIFSPSKALLLLPPSFALFLGAILMLSVIFKALDWKVRDSTFAQKISHHHQQCIIGRKKHNWRMQTKDKLMRCQTVIVDKSCVLKIKSAFFCFFGVIEILRETAKLKRRKNEKSKNCMLNVDFFPLITNGGKIQ